jgi:hypothetical protein
MTKAETDWTIHRLTTTDEPGYCLVLTQPGQYEIKDRVVNYTIVEILAGHLGQATAKRLQKAMAKGLRVRHGEIADDEYQRLTTGLMGNYELLGWRESPGLLNTTLPMEADELKVADEPAGYAEDTLKSDERRLLNKYRKLTEVDRRRLLAIADTLTKH